jgi:hypothetical protein
MLSILVVFKSYHFKLSITYIYIIIGSSASIETEPKADAIAWPKYPPCFSGYCTDRICCAQGTLSHSRSHIYIFKLYLIYYLDMCGQRFWIVIS